MLRWALRFFLLRVLPGRLLWFMTIADLFFLLRSLRRRIAGSAVPVNDPRRSRTAAPPRRV
jgi:hypothetical protein